MSESTRRRRIGSSKAVDLDNQLLMLRGNINRMKITNDPDELHNMYSWAISRMHVIECALRDLKEQLELKLEKGAK